MAKGQSKAKVVASPYPTDAAMRADGLDTLSSRIRHLAALGCKTGEISRIVVRGNGEHPKYQHVRNVLKTPLKGTSGGNNSESNSGTAN